MASVFNPAEQAVLNNIPEGDLVDLVAELDVAVPAVIVRDELLVLALDRISQRARAEGLPFSKWDREDLEALPAPHLRALAQACGTSGSVDALMKSGAKVYKRYQKDRPGSPVALLLPVLLAPLARRLAEGGRGAS